MVEEIKQNIVGGGPAIPEGCSKGKRFLAAIFDLIIIPIILGVVAGLLLFAAPVAARNVILIVVNVAWMTLKDLMWDGAAPGKKMAGIKVISVETGSKITVAQGFIRNILLIIPFVLVIGYIVEIIMLATKGERLGDLWAKTRVIPA